MFSNRTSRNIITQKGGVDKSEYLRRTIDSKNRTSLIQISPSSQPPQFFEDEEETKRFRGETVENDIFEEDNILGRSIDRLTTWIENIPKEQEISRQQTSTVKKRRTFKQKRTKTRTLPPPVPESRRRTPSPVQNVFEGRPGVIKTASGPTRMVRRSKTPYRIKYAKGPGGGVTHPVEWTRNLRSPIRPRKEATWYKHATQDVQRRQELVERHCSALKKKIKSAESVTKRKEATLRHVMKLVREMRDEKKSSSSSDNNSSSSSLETTKIKVLSELHSRIST